MESNSNGPLGWNTLIRAEKKSVDVPGSSAKQIARRKPKLILDDDASDGEESDNGEETGVTKGISSK